MAINIPNLKPASIKSKNVATEDYVDSSSSNTLISAASYTDLGTVESKAYADLKKAEAIATASGNSAFQVNTLQSTLKTLAYKDSVSKAQLDSTIINGGYLQTNLVRADSIYADTALVAKLNALNITAGSVAASNITATNGFITNAMIADASISAAKIIDGNITNAKIGTASIDTLKIQGEAVVVNRFMSGTGNTNIYAGDFGLISMYYVPTQDHGAVFNFSTSSNAGALSLRINGSARASSGTHYEYLYAGVGYTIQVYSAIYYYNSSDGSQSTTITGTTNKQLTMIGAKR